MIGAFENGSYWEVTAKLQADGEEEDLTMTLGHMHEEAFVIVRRGPEGKDGAAHPSTFSGTMTKEEFSDLIAILFAKLLSRMPRTRAIYVLAKIAAAVFDW